MNRKEGRKPFALSLSKGFTERYKRFTIFSLIFAASFQLTCTNQQQVAPFIGVRSQGGYEINRILELPSFVHSPHAADPFFSLIPVYRRSLRSNRISRSLFGCSLAWRNCPSIRITGSSVKNRESLDWLADYFGLPVDYESVVRFKPVIKDGIFNAQLYLPFDRWIDHNLYLFVRAPLCHQRRSLEAKETIVNIGVSSYPSGYFAPEEVPRNKLSQTFLEYANGNSHPDLPDNLEFDRLCTAQVSCKSHSEVGLADLYLFLGYRKDIRECLSLACDVRIVAPTGTRPDARYLFEPIVGNGKYWEVGGGASVYWMFWTDECEDQTLTWITDLQMGHLFASKQKRTFDLCNKVLSRYMLAESFTKNNTSLQGTTTLATSIFSGVYTPVASLSTLPINSSHALRTELNSLIRYEHDSWEFDFGYCLWIRTCEKISIEKNCFPKNNWGLKGDAYTFGFDPENNTVPLSATNSTASIFSGNNRSESSPACPTINSMITCPDQNPGIDNPQPAFVTISGMLEPVTTANTDKQVNTSIQPILLTEQNLNICGAQTRGISQSAFVNLTYHRDKTCSHFQQFFSIGMLVEVGPTIQEVPCGPCKACNPTHVLLWVAGGVLFN